MANDDRNAGGGGVRQEEKSSEGKKPVKSFRFYCGSGTTVEAAVWEQYVGEGTQERLTYSVSISRSYRDGSEYKQSKGFWPQDLPHAMMAMQQAYLWIAEQNQRE